MAITLADFNKIWASTSPLTPYSFSESNYKQGWNFIGSTPPARQMWDFLQKQNDEKMQYLANNYLPLTGGTMSGAITSSTYAFLKRDIDSSGLMFAGATDYSKGSWLALFGKDNQYNGGSFQLVANNGTNGFTLLGKPDGTLTWNGHPILPTGVVQAFAGSTIPTGWLLCDGSAVSRTTYAGLFAVIGTTYGAGNGSTTFNLPNLTDKFIEGSGTAGTVKNAGLPNIGGNISRALFRDDSISTVGGAFISSEVLDSFYVNSSGSYGSLVNIKFSASVFSSIYGNSTTVQPPALTMKYIIKY